MLHFGIIYIVTFELIPFKMDLRFGLKKKQKTKFLVFAPNEIHVRFEERQRTKRENEMETDRVTYF